ncbi:MAG TPA: c-type cytochrome [Gemmatimonadales bacterium]|nr:c-type cytochrome [Gemmatimonadales bacterium]
MSSRSVSRRAAAALAAGALVALLGACEREARRFREVPPTVTGMAVVREVDLQPGNPIPVVTARSPYAENAYAVSQGKQLFQAYNCVGCHANGGGGMGPPLMDSEWIYGSAPENIVQTILGGRPNGMPSFGGKVPATQAWQLAAYVRSLSGLVRKDVAPGRSDHMQVRVQEQSLPEQRPRTSTVPPASERP